MIDDEILALIALTGNDPTDMIAFARVIESRTLIKQKARWYQEGVEAGKLQVLAEALGCAECGKGSGYALYCVACHDEFKTWVGLTDADYQAILVEHDNGGLLLFYHLIENKLKELNRVDV